MREEVDGLPVIAEHNLQQQRHGMPQALRQCFIGFGHVLGKCLGSEDGENRSERECARHTLALDCMLFARNQI
jgi:hypothetical protein